MPSEWNRLSEPLQIEIASEAMRQAVATVAAQADELADDMEAGVLRDEGGPDALRLLAVLIREAASVRSGPLGHA
jgi:hypothetical protein